MDEENRTMILIKLMKHYFKYKISVNMPVEFFLFTEDLISVINFENCLNY